MLEEVRYIIEPGRKVRFVRSDTDPGREHSAVQARLLPAEKAEPPSVHIPSDTEGDAPHRKARLTYITYGKPGGYRNPETLLTKALADYRKRFKDLPAVVVCNPKWAQDVKSALAEMKANAEVRVCGGCLCGEIWLGVNTNSEGRDGPVVEADS